MRLAALGLMLAFAQQFAPVLAQSNDLTLLHTVSLAHVNGGFDQMAADVAGTRLFLAAEDNNTVEVIDFAAGSHLTHISGFNEPKWIVYRPESHRLYVSNGNGSVRVLDSRTFDFLKRFDFKEKANNLRYDEKTGELFVGIGKTFGAIAIIDTKRDVVTGEITLADFPKQFEIDGNRIYVNVPGANHVAVIDRKKKSVIETWPVSAAKKNVPMGFDRARHRLFVGCEPGKLVVFDTQSGKSITSLDIGAEPDGIHYDAVRKRLYVSCGAGTVDVVQQIDADHYKLAGRVSTAPGAATSFFVPELRRLCVAVPQKEKQNAELRIYEVMK